jgi:hypothetical protein
MALSAAIFLGEGQARTLTSPPPSQSLNIQTTHSIEAEAKASPSEKIRGSQSTNLLHHPEVIAKKMDDEEKSHKKKFGLAILFLGVLAEKS